MIIFNRNKYISPEQPEFIRKPDFEEGERNEQKQRRKKIEKKKKLNKSNLNFLKELNLQLNDNE